jgi:stalled ribosome rescue protein Dom34
MCAIHVVVWLDHSEAHVIRFNREDSVSELVRSGVRPHLHVKAGAVGSGRAAENESYLEEIAVAVSKAEEILVVGPGFERLEFMKYLKRHHPAVADRILGLEAVDHPSDGALLAYARKYFHRIDQLGLPGNNLQ